MAAEKKLVKGEEEAAGCGVLVTGAAGFIGSHVCEELVSRGLRVAGLDDFSSGCRENLASLEGNPLFRLVEGDACDAPLVGRLLREECPEAVVHLAALVSVPRSIEDPELNFRLNLAGSQTVLEAARIAGVRRFVFASSAAVYGDAETLPLNEAATVRPLSPYGAAKLAVEQLLSAHAHCFAMSTTALRFFNVYGPRQDPSSPYSGVISIFAQRLASGTPLTVFGDGEQTRDFVFVKDIARGVADAAQCDARGFRVANCCTGRSTSLLDLIRAFAPVFPEGEPEVRLEAERPGEIRHSLGDPGAFARIFGWVPATPLVEGLRELVLAGGGVVRG